MFSNTFAGIAPASVPAFVVAEVIGGIVAIVVIKVLYPAYRGRSSRHHGAAPRFGHDLRGAVRRHFCPFTRCGP